MGVPLEQRRKAFLKPLTIRIDFMVNEAILYKACELIKVPFSEVKLIGGYFDHVFEVKNKPIILKIFKDDGNILSLIKAELDWIEYLSGHHVQVCKALPIIDNRYIVPLSDNYYLVVYAKAKGQHVNVNDSETWNSYLFENWGRTMGKMHALAINYTPKTKKRPDWYEHPLFHSELDFLDVEIQERWKVYVKQLRELPTTSNAYGIIHHDLHQHNFFIDDKKNLILILIDFGDCEYHWFAYDIAIVIYHAVQTCKNAEPQSKEAFAKAFFQSFMRGYELEHQLSSEWMQRIPFFLDFRQIYSYMYHMMYANTSNLNERQLKFLEHMKSNIKSDTPYLPFSLF